MTAKHTPIPGHPGYSITEDGRVFSVSHNWRSYGARELRADKNADGYPSVRLSVDGQRSRYSVHWLMAAAFLGPRPTPTHEIRHINGDKTDNRLANLAWGTRKENAADRERHGRTSRGLRHSIAIKRGLEARHV